MPEPPFPKNAPGPFYVEKDCCIGCEAPYHEAPDLMAHDESYHAHCYFKKQPEAPEEVERAISACFMSCCRSVRYAGDDPAILQRFKELNSADCCDVLCKSSGQSYPSSDRSHPLWDQDLDG